MCTQKVLHSIEDFLSFSLAQKSDFIVHCRFPKKTHKMWRWHDQDTRSAPDSGGDRGGGGCESNMNIKSRTTGRIRTRRTPGRHSTKWIIAATALFCIVTANLMVAQADAQKGLFRGLLGSKKINGHFNWRAVISEILLHEEREPTWTTFCFTRVF